MKYFEVLDQTYFPCFGFSKNIQQWKQFDFQRRHISKIIIDDKLVYVFYLYVNSK